MRFGPVPLAEAEGAILAHSVAVPGGRIRKGRVLDDGAIARLAAAGLSEVVVARLGPEDVHEDAAADALARALVPEPSTAGLRLGSAATGRVNIFSDVRGVVGVDRAAIDSANGVDPAITVATVPEWQRLDQGGMVATVKIIPYAVGDPRWSGLAARPGERSGRIPSRSRRQPFFRRSSATMTVRRATARSARASSVSASLSVRRPCCPTRRTRLPGRSRRRTAS